MGLDARSRHLASNQYEGYMGDGYPFSPSAAKRQDMDSLMKASYPDLAAELSQGCFRQTSSAMQLINKPGIS